MNNFWMTIIAAFIFTNAVAGQPEISPPLPGYKLVWSDDFDGSTLDLTKWGYRTGTRLLSLQKPENVSVDKGMLLISLKKEDAGGLHYTAGGIISKKQFTYGYFEARFRCPKSAGWHTAFWTIYNGESHESNAKTEKDQPSVRDQEIDICEQDSVNNRSYSAGVIDWSRKTGKKSVGYSPRDLHALRIFRRAFSDLVMYPLDQARATSSLVPHSANAKSACANHCRTIQQFRRYR